MGPAHGTPFYSSSGNRRRGTMADAEAAAMMGDVEESFEVGQAVWIEENTNAVW